MSLTKEEIDRCLDSATSFFQLASMADVELWKEYIAQINPQIDGTMDAILPHFFSISDMRTAQRNGKFIVEVLRLVMQIKDLANKYPNGVSR